LISKADLDSAPFAPFSKQLRRWLERAGVEAALVRPDKYVFGSGDPERLREAWNLTLGG
jgi:3-(3-hydroxy-phenyl)propionate hydroxylase